ncbi:hypothetical protein C2845_PM13G12460 [Panicum miliaceum]|uniref:Uncharacterized protein n=1 Tax=Panicum miliaceum TaxID=4540 RepID=A0A3L6RM32_PANMI|nr:hypothetical protein C2845_PM13G12460 [Panicum miliaceum]
MGNATRRGYGRVGRASRVGPASIAFILSPARKINRSSPTRRSSAQGCRAGRRAGSSVGREAPRWSPHPQNFSRVSNYFPIAAPSCLRADRRRAPSSGHGGQLWAAGETCACGSRAAAPRALLHPYRRADHRRSSSGSYGGQAQEVEEEERMSC